MYAHFVYRFGFICSKVKMLKLKLEKVLEIILKIQQLFKTD